MVSVCIVHYHVSYEDTLNDVSYIVVFTIMYCHISFVCNSMIDKYQYASIVFHSTLLHHFISNYVTFFFSRPL